MCGDVKKADDWLDDEDAARLAVRLAGLVLTTRGWVRSLQKYEKKAPFDAMNDLNKFLFHIDRVASKIEARKLDSRSARMIVETEEQDFDELRLSVSPFISGGPMDTDAKGNDKQCSNATHDAQGNTVDTQGSSTEQLPSSTDQLLDELFAPLVNDAEGNDAKGQGKGNGDDPFEGLDGDETFNFIKDGEHRAIEYGASVSMMMCFGVDDDDAERAFETDADLKALDDLHRSLKKRRKNNRNVSAGSVRCK